MTTRIAAPVIATVSLAVLLSGCAGTVATGGGVRDDLRPAENAAAMGLARGHVIVRDDLSPSRGQDRLPTDAIEQAVQRTAPAFSPAAMRELKSGGPAQVDDDLSPLGGPR